MCGAFPDLGETGADACSTNIPSPSSGWGAGEGVRSNFSYSSRMNIVCV